MDDAINLHPTEPSTRHSSFWPDWRKVKRNCLIFFVVVLIAYIGLHIGVKIQIDRELAKSPYASSIVQIREFWKSDINFPKEWEAIPDIWLAFKNNRNDPSHPLYPIDQAFQTWNKPYNELGDWIHIMKETQKAITEDDWKTIQELLGRLDDEIHTGLDAIQKLEQEIVKLPATEYLPTIPEQDFAFVQLQNGLTLKAMFLAHEGKYNEAVETQMAVLPLYVHASIPGYISGLLSTRDIIANLLLQVANVWDEQPLQPWLEQLNRWEPYLFRMKKEHAQLYPLYKCLYQANLPIHYGKNVKAYTYYWDIKNAQRPPKDVRKILSMRFNQWFLGESQENFFDSLWEEKFDLIRPFLLTRTIEEAFMIGFYDCNAIKIYDQEQNLGNQYDELRLAIANKLYFLRNQKHPARMSDLVPDYFPHEINDRLTGKPVTWNNEEKK